MMKKFAQIYLATGEVAGIINLENEYAYQDGLVRDGILFKEIDRNVNDLEFPKTNYWRNDTWNTREVCPGRHYIWENFAWVKNMDLFWRGIRARRDALIAVTDWTQLADNSLDESVKTSFQAYRQQLRDIPATYSSAEEESDITWPAKPGV